MSKEFLWPNWVETIKDQAKKHGSVSFIGYGSLINPESSKRTLGETYNQVVTAFGVKRIFNFSLGDEDYIENGGRNKKSSDPSHRACLNVVEAEDDNTKLVGVLVNLKLDQIDAFTKREHGYDIIPVDYESSKSSGEAYVLIARGKGVGIGHMVQDDILPNESYLQTCIDGAKTHGDEFLAAWLDSCYLADGKTKLIESSFYKEFLGK